MQITHSPQALPGSCYVCGCGTRDSYVDFNLQIEFHGAFYLCNICAGAIAKLYTYITFDEYKDLQFNKEDLERQLYDATVRIDGLEKAIEGLRKAGYQILSTGEPGVLSGYGSVSDEIPREDSSEPRSEVGTGEGTPPESYDDEGMDILRSDDDGDESGADDFFGLGVPKGDE